MARITTISLENFIVTAMIKDEQSEDLPFPTAIGGEAVRAKETLRACPADHEPFYGSGWKGCCPLYVFSISFLHNSI